MNKSNVITFLIISSIILLAACTDQTAPINNSSITSVEVANVATMQGIQASNKCIQAATDTLNSVDTEYSDCSREVVKAWLQDKRWLDEGLY